MEHQQNFSERQIAARALAERGMSLIEIMIVVIIMAMIATGVAVAVIPRFQASQIDAAKTDVAAIRTAAQLYMVQNPGKCPTVEDLKTERYLDKNKRLVDPWDKEFVINCDGDSGDLEVFSTGPDMQEGGDDDIGKTVE